MVQEVVLEVRRASKRFPGVQALDGVSMELRQNEIVGLVGENGAGKSTLLKILIGAYSADSGDVLVRGKTIHPRNVKDAAAHGIAMLFQEQSSLPNLTVQENIFLGNEEPFIRFGLIDYRKMKEAAKKQLAKVGLTIDPGTYTADLDFATRQLVELARVMALEEQTHHEPILILDEPTTVLYKAEVEHLFELLRRLRAGATIIFVSHRLEELFEITDRVYVFKDGKKVAERKTSETNAAELHRLMVGREQRTAYYREAEQATPGEKVVLSVQNLSKRGSFEGVSFDLRQGEILGIAGVLGSGREAVLRALFGAETVDSGQVLVMGQELKLGSPSAAIQAGIGYVPQDRGGQGLILYLGIAPNVTLPKLRDVIRRGLLSYALEGHIAKGWIQRLKIRAPHHDVLCMNLSGGNQQKVVLAKWLTSRVKVLMLDHPTRGIDVGAKEELYDLMRELTKEGLSLLLISETLDETIGLSNTILTMRDGRVTNRFDAQPGSKPRAVELIGQMM